ncbi:MAG: SHOCT domain-containing protein [Clostridia bacterium]|nr:SHOCT domain-containing protein [Clostridia bacterium]
MKRTAFGWVVAATTLFFLMLAFVSVALYMYVYDFDDLDDVRTWLSLGIAGFLLILHCVCYMRSKVITPKIILGISLFSMIASITTAALSGTAADEFWVWRDDSMAPLFWICCGACIAAAVFYFVYFIHAIVRLFDPLREKRRKQTSIRARENAYKKISGFHAYYQKGIITEEEYNESRQRVLDALAADEAKINAKKTPPSHFAAENKTLGTAWLKFHTYFRLPVGGTLCVVAAIRCFTVVSINPNIWFQIVECLLYACFSFVAFVYTKNHKPTGYYLNMGMSIFNVVIGGLSLCGAIALLVISPLSAISMMPLIAPAVIDICNIIYFKKRRMLFFTKPADRNYTATKQPLESNQCTPDEMQNSEEAMQQ